MVSTRPGTTVSVALVRILLNYVARLGLAHIDICAAAGVDLSIVADSEARISVKEFLTLWEIAVEKTGNQNFGLHFGKEIGKHFPGGHIHFIVMVNCPTVRDAMERLIRYNNLMADATLPKMVLQDDLLYFSLDVLNPNIEISRHISEALLSSFIHMFRHLTENNMNLVEVRFKHSCPEDTREHQNIFEAPILFDQPHNELVIEREFLDLPILLANPELLENLEQFAQKLLDRLYVSDVWSEKVIRLLGNLLVRGEETGIENIAMNLAMSVRNLQIKLKKEGTSYRRLLDAVRKEIAMSYLKGKEVAICDIAFLLGFSEQSAFNHAFKRWTGFNPRDYLKKGDR